MLRVWGGALAAVLVLCQAAAAQPAVDLVHAVADAERLPPAVRPAVRYVSLYAIEPADRKLAAATLSAAINSVSRSAVLTLPAPVPGTRGQLWRIDLAALAADPDDAAELAGLAAVWESMVSQGEPYWHIRAQVIDHKGIAAGYCDAGTWRNCRRVQPGRSAAGKVVDVYTDGGWVDLAAAARLRAATGSGGAVVESRWLIDQMLRPPFYWLFLDLAKTRGEWYQQLGADAETIIELQANKGALLRRSGVTYEVRKLSRWAGPLGGVWNTYDVSRSTADKDFFRDPTGEQTRSDAGEFIAAQRNGLLQYFIADGAGRRADVVPGGIALDTSTHPVGEIDPAIDCIHCHALTRAGLEQDGLIGFSDDQAERLASGRLKLYAAEKATILELQSFYGRQPALQRELKRDREDYREALAACSGLTPEQFGRGLEVVLEYREGMVSPAQAVLELGLPAGCGLGEILAGAQDPTLGDLAEGYSVQREQWEASYHAAAILAAERGKR